MGSLTDISYSYNINFLNTPSACNRSHILLSPSSHPNKTMLSLLTEV